MKFADVQGIFMYMQIDDKYATNKMHIPCAMSDAGFWI